MNKNYYAILMAGGVGSRFWPVSTTEFPKQFHDMLGTGETLIQKTFSRLSQLIPKENILILTNEAYNAIVLEQLPMVSQEQIVLEPAMRNTAPCILFASLKIKKLNPNAVVVVAPSDHWIEDEVQFVANLQLSFDLCEREETLMTLGILPTFPNTGYGYIEYEGKDVLSFREKPNTETAQEFLERGTFLWNSGMFCFKAGVLLEELKQYQPEVFEKCVATWKKSENNQLDAESSLQISSISIDYAVMERSKRIKVVPAHFRWNDLGSFESLYDYLRANGHAVDEHGNMIIGTDIFTTFVGMQDCIFVHTTDAMMILQKEKSQDVKKIYNQLEKYQSILR